MVKSITPKSGVLKDLKVGKLEFDPNITLIVGKNGSGKSLILKTLQHYFPLTFIEPIRLRFGFQDDMVFDNYLNDFHSKADIDYIGGKVHLVDSREYANVNARFDDDMPTTMQRLLSHDSGGEDMRAACMNLFSIDSTINSYFEYLKREKEAMNDVWREAVDMFFEHYKPHDHSQKPTLLIDEYDTNLDLDHQRGYINAVLPKLAETWQVICVSHSIFAHTSEHKVISLDDSNERYKSIVC